MTRPCYSMVVLVMTACSRGNLPPEAIEKPTSPEAASASHSDEPAHEAMPRRVRLDPSVAETANIKTAPVAREVLAATVNLPGEITSDPDKTARVSSLVAGTIDSVSFREGQQVKKGQVLAVVKVPDLGKAKANYLATSAKAAAARTNADRLQELADKRLAANQEVLSATAEADALAAEAQAAEQQVRALGVGMSPSAGSRLVIRAPMSGTVISRDAMVGQPITSDQVIATVADLSEVWFMGRVFEKNLGEIHSGAEAEVHLNAYPKEWFRGTVEYLGKQIDPTARTLTARIRIVNREELLRLGLFGVARVASHNNDVETPPGVVVSRNALTELGNKPVVFVRQPDGDYDVHEVVLGEGALGKVQVLSGLREGEQVVVEGVFSLKSVVLKGTFGEEE